MEGPDWAPGTGRGGDTSHAFARSHPSAVADARHVAASAARSCFGPHGNPPARSPRSPSRCWMRRSCRTTSTSIWWTGRPSMCSAWGWAPVCTCGAPAPARWVPRGVCLCTGASPAPSSPQYTHRDPGSISMSQAPAMALLARASQPPSPSPPSHGPPRQQ